MAPRPRSGPAALLEALLPAHLRYDEEARAACLWLADVGDALILCAASLRGLAQAQGAS